MPYEKRTHGDSLREVIDDFFDLKRINELKKENKASILRAAYLKHGLEISPEDEEDLRIYENADLLSEPEKKTVCSRASSLNLIPKYHRGLQAFDLALNPNVQEIINTANCSLRNDTTNRLDLETTGATGERKNKRRRTLISNTPSQTTAGSGSTFQTSYSPSIRIVGSVNSVSTLGSTSTSFHANLPACVKKFVFQSVIDQHMEFMTANNTTDLPWLVDRLETSSRSCRFSIPMDVLEFRSMSPIEYLEKFCKVCKERQIYYKKCFENWLDKTQGKHVKLITDGERLVEALSEVLHKYVQRREILDFLKLVTIQPNHLNNTPINLNTFTLIATLADRILCVSLVSIPMLKKYHDPRDFLERADFSGLASKLRGVHFQHNKLLKLLFSLS